ncbi:MAG: hypothetical protein U1E14_09125 [Geminicoccaceae bacterium]
MSPSPPPDHAGPAAVTLLVAERPRCIVLFAAGRGGDPQRHRPLLETLRARGCTVVAPRLALLPSPVPTGPELAARVDGLGTAADRHADAGLPLVGVGHSLGAVALLVLAGAEARTLAGEAVTAVPRPIDRLLLLAPPAGFLLHPGALDAVSARVLIRVGGADTVTPPAQAALLRDRLARHVPAGLRLDPAAGHFSYMDELPPGVADAQPGRAAFLAALADDVARFATDSG